MGRNAAKIERKAYAATCSPFANQNFHSSGMALEIDSGTGFSARSS
jgi:hypothetical protein